MERDVPLTQFTKIHKLYSKHYVEIWLAKYSGNPVGQDHPYYILKIFDKDKIMEDDSLQNQVLNERDVLREMQGGG